MSVTTNGWGAVNAASYDVVNRSIQKQGSLPDGFAFTSSGKLMTMDITCTVSGGKDDKEQLCTWKEWKLIPGGSGSIVYMTCVMETAYAHFQIASSDQSQIYDISGSELYISLNLKATADANYNIKTLPGTANKIVADTDQAVQILNKTVFSGLDPQKDEIVIDLLKDGFSAYLNSHLKDFAVAFAVVMLGGKIAEAKKDFQWMLPTDISYAVEQTYDKHDYFGILTMIDNDKITTQSQQLDVRAFSNMPTDANSILIVSAEKFCKHIILPSAINVVTGSTINDFDIGTDGLTIINNKELKWDKFKINDGTVIQPILPKGSFNMRVESDCIVIEIFGMRYSPSAGITVVTNLTQKVQIQMVKNSDDAMVLTVDPKSAFNYSSIHSSIEVAEWLKIMEILLDVTAAIAALAGGVGVIGEKIAAKAATTAVESAAAEVEMTASSISEVVETSGEEVANAITDAAVQISTGVEAQTSGFFASNYVKILEKVCGVVAGACGVSIGIIELIKYIENKQFDNLPTLNDFAKILLENYAWPKLDDAKIVNAELSDSLLIYTDIPLDEK